MQKLRFVNGNGVELDLTDNVKYGVVDWAGFSECGNEIQSQTVPFSDGSVYLDTLLSERELSVTIAISDGGDLAKRYEYKRELIQLFNPKLGEGYLYYKNDFIEKRIKVVPSLPIFPTKNSDNGGTLKAEISFTACDPYFEDVDETIVQLLTGASVSVENNGDSALHPTVQIIADCSHFEIENLTNGTKCSMNGVENKQFIKLDTAQGNKNIYSEKLNIDLDYCNSFDTMDCALNTRENKVLFLFDIEDNPDSYGNFIAVSDEDFKHTTISNVIKGNGIFGIRRLIYNENDNCYYLSNTNSIYKSTDIFENIELLYTFDTNITSFNLVKEKFYVATDGKTYTSTDLVSWTRVANVEYTSFCINEADMYVVAVDSDGNVYRTRYPSNNWNVTDVPFSVEKVCYSSFHAS